MITNRTLFKDRQQFHIYMDRDLMEKTVNRSLDLNLSSSAYVRMLIINDLKKNERNK